MLGQPLVDAHWCDAELVCDFRHRAVVAEVFLLQPLLLVIKRLGWLDEVLDFNDENISFAAVYFMSLKTCLCELCVAHTNPFAAVGVNHFHHVTTQACALYKTLDTSAVSDSENTALFSHPIVHNFVIGHGSDSLFTATGTAAKALTGTATQGDPPFPNDNSERISPVALPLSTMYVFFYRKTYSHTTSFIPPPIGMRSVVRTVDDFHSGHRTQNRADLLGSHTDCLR